MGVIFMPKYLIWQRQKIAHILSLIMHFHTGNIYCGVMMNVHKSIFLTKKQIKNMNKQHPRLGFTFITSLDVVVLMVEFHWKTKNIYYMCKQESSWDKCKNIYTRKELVMMETTISYFHNRFYIPSIQKLAFHLPHLRILRTNHCGKCDAQPSNCVDYINMFYVVVIMLIGLLQALIIKYNHNTVVEIYPCL